MKKLLFVLPILALLASGCTPTQQANNQTPAAINTNLAPSPSFTPSPTPTSTPTTTNSNTQTYTNTKYGFEIKYPASYTVKEYGANNFSIYASSNTNVPSIVYLNWEYTNQPLSEIIQEKTKSISISEATQTTINGIPAYEAVDLGMFSSYAVFFKNSSSLIEINFKSGNDNGLAKNKAALTDTQKLILSTFKFTK